MRSSHGLQHLLVFITALALTQAQTTSAPTTLTESSTSETSTSETSTDTPVTTMTTSTVPSVLEATTTQPWTVPEIFYPFGSAVGDTEHVVINDESSYSVVLSTPFKFFGNTYNNIYVMFNGLLTFTITYTSGPNYSPFRGTEDFIAALWSDLDDYYTGVSSYQQYTNGSVLSRATQDVNHYFSPLNFNASWVFVATWKYGSQPKPAILFQAVLISGVGQSYFLLNYGDCAVLYEPVEAGYDTINSISSFTIPDSVNGNYQNLKNTSNVNVAGRWAFNAWAAVTTMTTTAVPSVLATTSAQPWTVPAIFYPFGSAVGDTEYYESGGESYYSVGLSTPFKFFGHTYSNIYVVYNGLLTFTFTSTSGPNYSPFRGSEDFIAALWSDFDDYYSGVLSYQQYTNGSVLNRATQDVNHYFSPLNFNASWVFVATWKYGSQPNPAILFQAVLISGGGQSYFLLNYGDCAVLYEPVEAGYDTINSISNFKIPDSVNGNYQNLKNTSNVNVAGRWAFNAWAAPAIFYPFGSAVGDTEQSETGGESYFSVGLSTPFSYFNNTYNNIYVNYNGLLTFNMRSISGPYYNPSRGTEDVIAALWNDFDDDYQGLYSYQQYTNGSVLNRATQDINHYFSPGNFSASWVFVVTWRYNLQPNPAILFQVVLVSSGSRSFFLMNYGDCAVLYGQVEAGYDTINSISSFIIPDSTNGNYQNLKNTSNVNIPGRWAFSANNGSAVTTTTTAVPSVLATTSAQPWTVPAIFYPFGSAVGDTEHAVIYDESAYSVGLSTPFTFFGHTYSNIYVIYNGLLTFTITSTSGPYYSPFRGTEDFIAVLWGDFDDYYTGVLSYQQYTNGSVLNRATQDVNYYFAPPNFRASWVFVATWKYGSQPNPEILFQAVLISGAGQSYFLLNYGDCTVLYEPVEAGYDTINSISHFVIPDSKNGNYQNLKNTSNVNVPGRWAFNAWAAPAIFYPFGSAVGDTEQSEFGAESYFSVGLSTPFTYYGHTYNNIYINYNGLLTFNMRSISGPYYNPSRGTEDVIAALWNDFDDYYSGLFSYQQYTNGSVLNRATQDINHYFSPGDFSASWVFVVTWRYNLHPNPSVLFQVVFISDGDRSFFLMNYGDCAVLYGQVEAGYDTINSVSSFIIPDSINGNYQNLKNTSNVNVPGRWAFVSNKGLENVVGAQIRVTSFSDLTQDGNLDAFLQQIKQVLVSHGVSDSIQIKKRNVKKIQP